MENVTFDYEAKDFPAWIPYDKKLTLNNAKVGVDNTQVTEDKVAIINMGLPEEKIYGNFEGSDGRWTDTMEDNYSSVMDFSALSSASGPAELVAKLKELSGSGFSVTCSTCRLKYAVYFTSDEDVGINDTVTGVTESAKVDLTDLINRAGGVNRVLPSPRSWLAA